jgi:DNA repair exonuclease SbcCD nuclease subunit
VSAAGQLRILHTADVHLSDDLDPEARFAGWRAFLGQAGQADLLIVAGDLFDHGRVPQSLLDQVVEDLAATPVPVVILPGNHDLAGPGSVQERFDVTRAGPHVISLDAPDGRTAEVPGLDVTVWGRGMTDHTPANNPLAGHAAPGRGRWHIAVAHGHFQPAGPGEGRSSPLAEADLAVLECDYLALGHWHRYFEIPVAGVTGGYPGPPSRGYLGPPATANLVTLGRAPRAIIERLAL